VASAQGARWILSDTLDDLLQRFHGLTQDGRGQEVLNLDWQFAHANACGVIGRRSNRSRDTG
jgi:hypothetical protein